MKPLQPPTMQVYATSSPKLLVQNSNQRAWAKQAIQEHLNISLCFLQKKQAAIACTGRAPAKESEQDLRVVMHIPYTWAIAIAVHAEDSTTDLESSPAQRRSIIVVLIH